ncbi:MAG TPA: DUF3488 and transglutaminase-like domain-containing protein [Candidatus Desulfobacillus sp.]|nr:DUF3488 and transglutaminase-like domain-containing protein [Candidatus Desulfobacillus sp.]
MATRQPSPPLTRAQESWLLAGALIALAGGVFRLPPWLGAAVVLLFFLRATLWWRRQPLPPRWLLGLLVLAASAGVLLTFRQFFGRGPGTALLTLLLVLKLFELRRARDGVAVVFLSFFLLLVHFLEAQGLSMAALALAALLVLVAALASLADDGRKIADHLRLSALMLAQAAPFMLVLFLLFPRVQGPLWGMPADAWSGLSGLSDSMSPGSISSLSLSGAIAFRVRFEGEAPAQAQLYWRGPVLRDFDGRTWRAGSEQAATGAAASAAGLEYTVTLEPHNRRWLYALDVPLAAPPDAHLSAEYQVLAKAPVRSRIRYEMRSAPSLALDTGAHAASLQPYLDLPANNPRIRALAAQWRRESPDEGAIIARMLRHFRGEKFFYTLTPPLLGEDGVDQFLFETRRGFCEHYASAFVFAMRAAGIPARVVTGYQGGERNPVDGWLTVRQSDAHAWAEVWLAGKGWLRVDPTAAIAPERVEAGLASALPAGEPLPFLARADLSWLRQLRFRWEAVGNAWNQWVLGYDSQRQRELLSRLGMREPDWRAMTALMTVLCATLLAGLAAWVLRRQASTDRVQLAWQRLGRKLARSGLERCPWEGPRDYSLRVAQARPDLAQDVRAIAALYIGLRYGKLAGKASLQQLEKRVADLKPALRR